MEHTTTGLCGPVPCTVPVTPRAGWSCEGRWRGEQEPPAPAYGLLQGSPHARSASAWISAIALHRHRCSLRSAGTLPITSPLPSALNPLLGSRDGGWNEHFRFDHVEDLRRQCERAGSSASRVRDPERFRLLDRREWCWIIVQQRISPFDGGCAFTGRHGFVRQPSDQR